MAVTYFRPTKKRHVKDYKAPNWHILAPSRFPPQFLKGLCGFRYDNILKDAEISTRRDPSGPQCRRCRQLMGFDEELPKDAF